MNSRKYIFVTYLSIFNKEREKFIILLITFKKKMVQIEFCIDFGCYAKFLFALNFLEKYWIRIYYLL